MWTVDQKRPDINLIVDLKSLVAGQLLARAQLFEPLDRRLHIFRLGTAEGQSSTLNAARTRLDAGVLASHMMRRRVVTAALDACCSLATDRENASRRA